MFHFWSYSARHFQIPAMSLFLHGIASRKMRRSLAYGFCAHTTTFRLKFHLFIIAFFAGARAIWYLFLFIAFRDYIHWKYYARVYIPLASARVASYIFLQYRWDNSLHFGTAPQISKFARSSFLSHHYFSNSFTGRLFMENVVTK